MILGVISSGLSHNLAYINDCSAYRQLKKFLIIASQMAAKIRIWSF
jgi:hypothetical protein